MRLIYTTGDKMTEHDIKKLNYILQFMTSEGKPFCTINLDGSVTFSEDYDKYVASNDAAQILWNVIEEQFKIRVKSMVKEELENMYKGKPPKEIVE
jgi:hypothetical protein